MVLAVTDQSFERDVLESPIPVLVHFWAPWCGVCKLIAPQLQQFQIDSQQQVKVVSINADENFRLANTYKLQTLPTLLWIRQGKIVARFEGLKSRDDLKRELENLLTQERPAA